MKFWTYFLLIAVFAFTSCNDEDEVTLECDKLSSKEEAYDLMNQVNDNKLIDASMIEDNLIGEWGLIGVMPGWVEFEPGKECFRLTISARDIELEDLNTGIKSHSPWELKVYEVNGFTGFHLETNEDVWNNRMGMQIFSKDVMYGSGRVDDGDTYIYEKLK